MENAKADDRQWMTQRVRMDLQYASAQIAPLRRVVSAHLELWGLDGVADAWTLIASELCSNVRHVEDPAYMLTLSRTGSDVRIEVRDASTALPELPAGPPDFLDVGGRGLFLVVSLADRAGVTPLADGKIIWAECSASASREVR
ncbi:ATP-binding protein [Streptomyces sp. NBC_01615]|uniref:ATP-binding protein n=1 Tax=Streptomyces sp. NBC_01615 TaxID=2975898 RepID=UPI003870155F